MRKNILLLFVLSAMPALVAQSKFNPQALVLMNEAKAMMKPMSDDNQSKVSVLVLVTDDVDLDAIRSIGGEITLVDGDVIGVNINPAQLEELSQVAGVEYIEYNKLAEPKLDFARSSAMVDEAHAGFEHNGAVHSFDGTGVVTGLFDQGVDPGHINFYDANGNHRVKRVFNFSGMGGTFNTPDPSTFGTDDSNASHGSHVAGIMAGRSHTAGTYAYISSPSGSVIKVEEGAVPYYGVATGSDVVMSCGQFSDANIIAAVRAMFDYAESVGKPAVVNLSLGNNIGPHDGSDLLSYRLSIQAKRGLVCISSGNEGDVPFYVNKVFTDSETEVKTFFTGNAPTGTIEVWGSDDKPMKVSVVTFSKNTATITEVATVNADGQNVNSSNSNSFNSNFNGSITVNSDINSRNDRFVATIYCNGVSQKNSNYYLGILVEGAAGQEVCIYGNEDTTFTNNSRSGWAKGTCDGSINALACADGVVSVGAYVSRTTYGTITKGLYRYNSGEYIVDDIAPFSSWGKKFGAEWLPTVCGPGANIISSYNSYQSMSDGSRVAKVIAKNRTYSWGAMQGTSMSCPFVAGVVGLWLQACPTLTYEDVVDVIKNTSVSQDASAGGGIIIPGMGENTDKYRWGAGKIDAVAGLKYVLNNYSSVENIYSDNSNIIITPAEGGYSVMAAGQDAIQVALYDMQGRVVASVDSNSSEAFVSTAGVLPGIYVISVTSPTNQYTSKVKI